MKKRMKRLVALLLCMVMAASVLTGCGGSEEEKTNSGSEGKTEQKADTGSSSEKTDAEGSEVKDAPEIDTSEFVELKMYLIGDRTPDFDAVYDEVNVILKEKLNCTLSVDFLSWGEYGTKYSLLFSGGEEFDLIFTASGWCQYESTVALGGFYPLDSEFIQTYAPGIWEVLPEMAWSQAKIGGVPYMVPNYQNEFGQSTMAVRGDLMDKYGITQITNWDEMVKYFKACAADGIYASQGGPWYQYFQGQGLCALTGAPRSGEMVLYNAQDPSDLELTYILDWDGFADYCKQAKEMADLGCWSPDVLNSTDERQTGLLTGRCASMGWNLGSCAVYGKQANQEHPEWKVTLVDPSTSQAKKVNSYINNGVAINAMSENPERAMMVLNELYTNPKVNDLTRLGIEGKHWKAEGDMEFTVIDASTYGIDGNCCWGWINSEIRRTEYNPNKTSIDIELLEMTEAWNNNIKAEHPYDGFAFDTTSVSTQVAAVDAALGTYMDPLINGIVEDVDASIAEFKQALEVAGMNDILAEIERQAAEHVAGQ